MPYTLNRTDGTTLLILADGTVDNTRIINYVGKNYANYGEIFNENFVKLQENFAKTTPPSGALDGQLWYDKTNNVLKVYKGAVTGWAAIPVTANVTGTANQVTVTTSVGTGAVSLSLPQDINSAANPTFNTVTLGQTTGTAPFVVSSTTVVSNLNADLLDGQNGSYYLNFANLTNAPTFGTMATQNANVVAITGGSITGINDLAVADGGTGASTAAGARISLGLGTLATQSDNNISVSGGTITGITDLTISDGGTGASNAIDARTNLGLGTVSTQAADNVAITGGTISGITDLAVADGGTGASNAIDARTNLGVTAAISTAMQTLYPVGSIYINSAVATNPATLFGFGTWEAFGSGRVLVGFDNADSNFNVAEKIGGSKNAIVASHTHTATSTVTDSGHAHSIGYYPNLSGVGGGANISDGDTNSKNTTSATTGITVSTTIDSAGESNIDKNLQPFITVYMWKRTA